ncbi:MAG: hypothetical protein ACTS73_07600 [Arsenophonus sp. NEOnobi-MAG3]
MQKASKNSLPYLLAASGIFPSTGDFYEARSCGGCLASRPFSVKNNMDIALLSTIRRLKQQWLKITGN